MGEDVPHVCRVVVIDARSVFRQSVNGMVTACDLHIGALLDVLCPRAGKDIETRFGAGQSAREGGVVGVGPLEGVPACERKRARTIKEHVFVRESELRERVVELDVMRLDRVPRNAVVACLVAVESEFVEHVELQQEARGDLTQGAEAPLGSLWGSKLQETRKVISLTGHFTAFVMWPINASFFNKLPKDVQQVLMEEGRKAGAEMTRLTLANQDEYMNKFKAAGVTIVSDVDIPAFQKATASVYKAFPKWTPGLRETVLANLK